jgi:mannose-6-phosphate isomerase-like protein (cupin superfamily)
MNGMSYKLTKSVDVPKKEKFGIRLDVFPNVGGAGIVSVSVEIGYNQEFYDKQSTFTYIILEGNGTFFLDDETVEVAKGDVLSIEPNTRIYYKGKLKMILITTPAWKPENEVETRSTIW